MIITQSKQSPLPMCTPNLMPFHIGYTGPAPVSTFLRVEKMKAEEEEEKVKVKHKDDEQGEVVVVGEGDDAEGKVKEEVMVVNEGDENVKEVSKPFNASSSSSTLSPPTTLPQTSPSSVLKDIDKRFISSFRGRTIHGLNVDLPTGYTGLLLQSDSATQVESREMHVESNEKKSTRRRGRLTRSATQKRVVDPEVITVDDGDQEMADPAPSNNTTEPALNGDLNSLAEPLHQLIPQSTFSSITLWHADRAVDETRDEYYRTLTEWMALSHEIHRTDL